MRYKEGFVTTVNSLDNLSNQLKATNYEQIAKSLEKSSAGLNKAIDSIVSKIDYDTIYKSITASSLAASEAIRSISENYSKILNTISKIITEYSNSIEAVYKSLNSFYNSKEFITLCETLINSNNYNYSEEDTKEVINSITYKDIENINKIENKNDHLLPRQIIVWLMITFILEPLIAIPQEQITNWYKEQIPKIVEFINNKYKQLSEISIFSAEKISVSKLNRTSYISTENMLPNLSGITESASLPKVDKVTSFKKGDILLSNIRPYFKKMWYATFDGGCSNDVLVIRSEEGIDSKYLYYFLSQPTFFQYVTETSKGTKMPRGDKQAIMKYSIYLPSKIIQKKIVTILENIDKKIELNIKINNNLRELCKTNYLRLIENNIIELSLSELMDYQGGSQPPASEFQKEKSEDNIRFVQIRDFETDSYVCYIPNSKKNKLCSKDDILIARYGASLGRICYGLSGAYNVALAKVLPKKEEYKELLRVILESDGFYNYINQVGQRSAQAGFNAGDIAGFNVIIPDENGLKEFNSISKNVIDKRLLIIDENRKLSELRDTLLPKLMNGEIDLDNIEI